MILDNIIQLLIFTMYICAVSAIFNTPTYFVIVYELPHPYKNIELSIFVH